MEMEIAMLAPMATTPISRGMAAKSEVAPMADIDEIPPMMVCGSRSAESIHLPKQ